MAAIYCRIADSESKSWVSGGSTSASATSLATTTFNDIGAERRVLNRAAFGPNAGNLAHIQSIGWQAWLEEQLDFSSIDDRTNEEVVEAANFNAKDVTRLDRAYLQRCLASQNQLLMKMTAFWERHFNTDRRKAQNDNEIFEQERFRKLAFGRFEDLLIGSATSPAMIRYLDNASNVASAPNEHYAREVLELHTLGIDGPYTETDVAELARVFTGWRVLNNPGPGLYRPQIFNFRIAAHDPGPKSVMTWTTSGFSNEEGVNEGLTFLRYLARHPKTIDFISRKLCASFLEATPQESEIDRVKRTLSKPGATIADAVRVLFEIIANNPRYGRSKSLSNFEFVISMHRRLGLTTANLNRMANELENMGSPLCEFPAPTGLPDAGPRFEAPGVLIERWNFVHDLARNSISNSTVDYATLLGSPAPATVLALITHAADLLLDGDLDSKSRDQLQVWARKRVGSTPTQGQIDGLAPDLFSILLRLPAAQLN
ncbi:MAG: DUF1800 domain-containing protein [Planctomycetota bacterium]